MILEIPKEELQMSKLTTRTWKLYDLLKTNTERWMTQREIYEVLKGEYPIWDGVGDFHNTIARQEIASDIRELNDSDIIQKIILTNTLGVKIANEVEYKDYSVRKWKSIKGMIKRLAYKDNKAKLNGQMKLVFGDSIARDFYETFKTEEEETKHQLDRVVDIFNSDGLTVAFQIEIWRIIDNLKEWGDYRDDMTDDDLADFYQDLYYQGVL
jgi:hypothetical protein